MHWFAGLGKGGDPDPQSRRGPDRALSALQSDLIGYTAALIHIQPFPVRSLEGIFHAVPAHDGAN